MVEDEKLGCWVWECELFEEGTGPAPRCECELEVGCEEDAEDGGSRKGFWDGALIGERESGENTGGGGRSGGPPDPDCTPSPSPGFTPPPAVVMLPMLLGDAGLVFVVAV